MTADELRQALEAADVPFDADARKAELQALYDEHMAPSVVVQGRARPAYLTRRQARDWSQR